MKILQDLILLMAVAVGGYVVYKLYTASKAVASAAGSVGTAAASWTPGALASTVSNDFASGLSAVSDFVGLGTSGPATTVLPPPNPTFDAFTSDEFTPSAYNPFPMPPVGTGFQD